jgi:dihydropteroate synthase
MMTPAATTSASATGTMSSGGRDGTLVNGMAETGQRDLFDDLVWRIDRFLETDAETASAAGLDARDQARRDVRIGTQAKVRESLAVIEKALGEYTYVSLVCLFVCLFVRSSRMLLVFGLFVFVVFGVKE